MTQRYMVQTGTDYVYPYHALTAKRADMVEISEAQAKNLMAGRSIMDGVTAQDVINVIPGSAKQPEIRPEGAEDAAKTRIKSLEKKLNTALALLGMTSADQIPDDMNQGKVIMDNLEKGQDLEGPAPDDQGPPINLDIAMLEQIRIEGKGKARIEAYCLENFGVDVDRRLTVNKLVDQAIDLTNNKIAQDAIEAGKATAPDTGIPPRA